MCRSLVMLGLILGIAAPLAAAPDFNRDVRPILSQICFKCHGPDDGKREAGVRLDTRDGAHGKSSSDARIIVPGKPELSELIRRIESTDSDVVMPPPATHMTLSPTQRRILREWVAAGAEYQPHWAFVPPKRPALPAVKDAAWPRNGIDHFILSRLDQEGLAPSPAADRYTLLRRVTLDLLGLPPTSEEIDAFIHDTAPNAYERLVDRLLASPRYGERWARRWLDLARYADTNGYEKDRQRSVWPYRDWVINSLNADVPFDRFTIEQIAGDMLPKATIDQRIATGFHRNTMINEEGGIDPLEFRFHAMTDRIGTTGTVWLGLTVGCAQCHTHKFDPITHTDYYSLMAFLNNADEPELEVPSDKLLAEQAHQRAEITAREADLPNRFPPLDELAWTTPTVVEAKSQQKATLTPQADGAILASGENPESDTYVVTVETAEASVGALQIEALVDPSLGNQGPGRTPHGNFVLTELTVEPPTTGDKPQPVTLTSAMADFAQDQFPAANAIDGKPKTGWAIHGTGTWNVNRTLTVMFKEPVPSAAGKWTVRLAQRHGTQHTLGKFRIRLGRPSDPRPVAERRTQHLQQKFTAWLTDQQSRAVAWQTVIPTRWKTTLPKLELLPDGSLLASGDQAKRDVYDIEFGPELAGATALRIEAIADERLPKHGPGRVYYEGPFGDFFLSEVEWRAGEQKLSWGHAAGSFAAGNATAATAIDGDPLSGWSINGAQGRSHVAVFALADAAPQAAVYAVRLLFERYYAAGLGRFRFSITTDPRAKQSTALAPEVEALLVIPAADRTAAQQAALLQAFCATAPELASERTAIDQLRQQISAAPTTFAFTERPADNPRPTRMYRRGEYLQPLDEVHAAPLPFLHRLPKGTEANRLGFAKWLVSPENPLVGRVTVNRHWQAFFGRGLVRTMEDFGYQGELPSHPELLDWLALELVRQNWSIKDLHRLIVTSATYQQDGRVTPLLEERDPLNKLLARGPRLRLEAELVRDVLLALSGQLSDKLLGPSVFPPQPASVTSEGAYGSLAWNVSPGEDRHRRGLYTFTKRTAPFAMLTTFDAPSGESCVPRREVSNTPLQALTLLNDAVFVETAQQLGQRWSERPGDLAANARAFFQHCLTRPPTDDELAAVTAFFQRQHDRFAKNELPADKVAGPGTGDVNRRAAWTATARVLLNLDETITRD